MNTYWKTEIEPLVKALDEAWDDCIAACDNHPGFGKVIGLSNVSASLAVSTIEAIGTFREILDRS